MKSMKQGQGLILTLVTIVSVGMSANCRAELAPPSKLIQEDVEKIQDLSKENRPLVSNKRDKVEETQNNGINAGLYLQGLPTIKDKDGNDQFDPLFILHNHYDAKDTTQVQYCDQAATNEAANFACQSDPLMAHSDIKISTLLSGALLDDTRAAAVRWFMQNLIDPNPSAALKDAATVKTYLNSPEKQGELAKALAHQVQMSIARQPFAEMVAKRSMTTTGMSVMQKMEQDVSKKYLNNDWVAAQATGYATQLKKESGLEPLYDLAFMQAYNNWLELERYKQGERIEALLAGILVQLSSGAKFGEKVETQTQGPSVTPTGTIQTNENKPVTEGEGP